MAYQATVPGRRYAGLTGEQRAVRRREALLDAGLEVFTRSGFPGSSIQGICSTARLHPRYFYEHFRDREELLQAVYDRLVAGLRERILRAARDTDDDDLRGRAGAGARAFVEGMLADERNARLAYVEMIGASPALERHRRETLRSFAALHLTLIADFVRTGSLPRRDYRLTAMALVGASDELLIDWVSHPEDRAPVEAVVQELADLFYAAYTRA